MGHGTTVNGHSPKLRMSTCIDCSVISQPSDAWVAEGREVSSPESRPSSQASLHKTASGRGTPIFAKHTARVVPGLETGGSSGQEREELEGRRTPDMSVFTGEGSQSSLVTIEEATGEKVVEQELKLKPRQHSGYYNIEGGHRAYEPQVVL